MACIFPCLQRVSLQDSPVCIDPEGSIKTYSDHMISGPGALSSILCGDGAPSLRPTRRGTGLLDMETHSSSWTRIPMLVKLWTSKLAQIGRRGGLDCF